MLVNTILLKSSQRRTLRYKDLREMLKKTKDLMKSIGLTEDGAEV